MSEKDLQATNYETLIEQIDLKPAHKHLHDSVPRVDFATHSGVVPFRFALHPEFQKIAVTSRFSRISNINGAIAKTTGRALLNIGEQKDPAYINIIIYEYPLYKRLYNLTRPFPYWKLIPSTSAAESYWRDQSPLSYKQLRDSRPSRS